MNTYLVVFNSDPAKAPMQSRHQKLLDAVMSMDRLNLLTITSGFTSLIATSDSIDEVWEKLFTNNQGDFVNDDRLYIIAVCRPFNAYGQPKLRPWFEDHIPDEMNPLEDRLN